MNILCILCPFSHIFTDMGHNVLALNATGQEISLVSIMEEHRFVPDLIIQKEALGPRTVISDLSSAPCPTVFVAVDAHLNMFWHKYYTRLFDGVLSAHSSLFSALPPPYQPAAFCTLPPVGYARPWRPFAQRSYHMGMVGRLTADRMIRQWTVELLQEHGNLRFESSLDFMEMFNFYENTQIVPNESIAEEVNFRLMEAASCGCGVISQDIGPDQDRLFTQDKEILVYKDGLDLLEKVKWCKKNPDEAERIGHNAWLRVQAEHLPIHRAETILQFAQGLSCHRVTGENASIFYWLTQLYLSRRGLLQKTRSELLAQGFSLPLTPEVAVGLLCLLAEMDKAEQAVGFSQELLSMPVWDMGLAASASAVALRFDDFYLARLWWVRYMKERNKAQGVLPQNAVELCLAWANALHEQGLSLQTGFPYNPAEHLPLCAYDFVEYARHKDQNDLNIHRLSKNICLPFPAYAASTLENLAMLSLTEQDNWKLQLEYGLLCIKVCRIESGLFEVAEAHAKAKAQGQDKAFAAMEKSLCKHILKMGSGGIPKLA